VTQVNAYLQPQAASHYFSGSVLIERGSQILLDRGYGMADEARRISDGPNTVFPIESISKAFTAAAILQLQERGKLKVTDHLCRFIPRCPLYWKPVTVQHLLTMTSGLPNYTFIPNEDMSPARAFAFLGQEKPLSKAGKIWSYNNFSYDFLAYIIQKLSGDTYWAYLRDHIFKTLHMKHSGFRFALGSTPNHALSYNGRDTKHPIPIQPEGKLPSNMSFLDGDAAITSTVGDLALWNAALNGAGLLSKKDLSAMFRAQVNTGTGAPFSFSYGYGWFVDRLYNHPLDQHRGGSELMWGYDFRFPDRHVSLVVLCNRPDSNSDVIITNLSRIVLNSVYERSDRLKSYGRLLDI
jgi:CubicO group peptidase (beta-lactamase class C family)